MLANMQYLRNTMDELTACAKFLSEYRNTYIFTLTVTWLKEQDSNSDLEIESFGQPLRLDLDPHKTGKVQGEGVCSYVNIRECMTVIVFETVQRQY